LAEIRVLRDHREAMLGSVSPNLRVVGRFQSDLPNVDRSNKDVCQRFTEPRRKILIEQELHAGMLARRRSRSAANARHASMSS